MKKQGRDEHRSEGSTIHDVAERAEVAISTVSFALKGDARVTEATRRKVLAAATELGYHPNVAAQGLAARKTNLIAVWGWFGKDSLEFSYYSGSQMLMGILDRLKGTRFGLYLSDWSTMSGENRHLLDHPTNHRFICGSIWMSYNLESNLRRLAKAMDLPIALIEAQLKGYDSIFFDNKKGAYEGARHLLKKSGRLALVVSDPKGLSQMQCIAGVKQAAKEAGLPWKQVRVLEAPSYSVTDGEAISKKLVSMLGRDRGRLGVFCLAGDTTALGILHGLHRAGVPVPSRVGVIGWDGRSEGHYSTPSLTTIVQPFFEMGRQAAECLIRRIEDPSREAQSICFQPHLLIRDSA